MGKIREDLRKATRTVLSHCKIERVSRITEPVIWSGLSTIRIKNVRIFFFLQESRNESLPDQGIMSHKP